MTFVCWKTRCGNDPVWIATSENGLPAMATCGDHVDALMRLGVDRLYAIDETHKLNAEALAALQAQTEYRHRREQHQ
jgi:hypothetical protein